MMWMQRRKAKRSYYCYKCSLPINKGDQYAIIAYKMAKEWIHRRLCSSCADDLNTQRIAQ